jgi:hypothetical protein
MLASSKIALLLLILAAPVLAQTLYGSLVGTVTDESGLAVPGATVTITHTETNQKRDATTNTTGGYNFTNIPTGTYQVEIALPGFQTFRARGIIVQQNNSVRIDAKLGVGALQETVVVSGTAAILQTESAAVQSVTTSQQIENLREHSERYVRLGLRMSF